MEKQHGESRTAQGYITRREGKLRGQDAADSDGRFSIGLRISVSDGAPAKLNVKRRISRAITDEVESTVDNSGQMKLL